MTETLKKLARTAVLAAFLVVALSANASAANAATPCWKQLINDWYDGRIDKIYPRHCYKEAIRHLPPDVEIYSNARSDIERALQFAALGKLPPPNRPPGKGQKGNDKGNIGGEAPETPATQRLLEKLGPSKADSAPIPLLVLGGLALLLMAAGGAGVVARKIQERREPPPQT